MNSRSTTLSSIISSPWAIIAILILGLLLRLHGLSQGIGFHPDERHIVGVTHGLSLEDPNPHFFAYGSLPFYLTWGISEGLGYFWPFLNTYDGLFYVGRMLSILVGVLGVWFTWLLSLRLFKDRDSAALAALLLALNVFHLQLSRFYTVDVILGTLSLAVLYICVRAINGHSWRLLLIAGIATGASIATKIGALTLLLPLGLTWVAITASSKRYRQVSSWMIGFATLLAVAGTFLFWEPYAILDYQKFLANNQEQIRMVMGEWRPPYTIQYENTTPYLYHLQQIAQHMMGWPLALAVFAGVVAAGIRQSRKFCATEFVLLAWVIAFFFTTGGQQVKFPRYLVPLYPLLMIWAGHFLVRLYYWMAERFDRRVALVPGTIVVLWCAVYAVAFSSIYAGEHSYIAASRWIFTNVPRNSQILGVHWDDRPPVTLPGFSPHEYGYRYEGPENELPLYEKDDTPKLVLVSRRVAATDYIVFPTQRLPGSIMRVPLEFPNTTAFFRLLYGDQLGFKLVQTVKRQPQLGPFTFNTDLADESFSVYDHPKVAIFENVERLPDFEIRRRILAASGSDSFQGRPLPTREQVLLRDAGSKISGVESVSMFGSLFAVLRWYLVLQAFALVALLFCARFFADRLGLVYPLTKVLGLVLCGWFTWFLESIGVLSATSIGGWFSILILLGCCCAIRPTQVAKIWSSYRSTVRSTEIIFGATFIAWLVAIAFHPEIYWGEKPMDFTFLNYFVRGAELPPTDPWAAGSAMHYYYYGSYLMALLHRLSFVDTAVGYNLGLASVGALLVVTLFGVLRMLTERAWVAVSGALAIAVGANAEWINLWIVQGKELNFDLFWATTRLYTSPQITEYPQWSILFGDLHAHVIALPFVALLIGILLLLHNCESWRTRWIALAMCGITYGSLIAINTWDALTCGLMVAIVLTMRAMHGATVRGAVSFSTLGLNLFRGAADGAVIAGSGMLLFAPFLLGSLSTSSAGWGWVTGREFNTIGMIFRHLGTWLVIISAGLLSWWCSTSRKISLANLVVALIVAALSITLACISIWRGTTEMPWGIIGCAAGFAALCSYTYLSSDSPRDSAIAGFAVCAAWLVVLAEVCFLMDRMNTSFKVYDLVWLLLGIVAVVLIDYLLNHRSKLSRALTGISFGAIGVGAIGAALNIGIMTTFKRVDGPRPTLDGLAYLQNRDYNEAALVTWMRANIGGTPVLLEAFGPSYREFTRVSMNTGLPTVLGWDHHVKQRGLDVKELERRRSDIATIFSSTDLAIVQNLIARHKIELIVVGDVERKSHGTLGVRKFADHPELFKVLFRSGDVTLYATQFWSE